MTTPHISVLEQEVLNCFKDKKLTLFIDGTFGAGGHSLAILREHPEIECYIGIDQDPEALLIAKERFNKELVSSRAKCHFIESNFSEIASIVPQLTNKKADAILFDLGVSSMQLDRAEKGFSFMKSGPLDMRMSPKLPLSAADVVNSFPEKEIADIIYTFGEERRSRVIAKAICLARKREPIATTDALSELIYRAVGKREKIHPATRTFQALRIFVNGELEVIQKAIPDAINLLAPEGSLAVISFHSLEDRLIKNLFRDRAKDRDRYRLVTKKPLIATDEEMRLNPRSRSAKLRVIEAL